MSSIKLFILLLYFFVAFLTIAYASESTPSYEFEKRTKDLRIEEYLLDSLPSARLLPDNFFYFIKSLWEKFVLLTTFNPVKKTRLYIKFAENRLSEALNLATVKKVHISEKLLSVYDVLIDKANQAFEDANKKGLDVSDLGILLSEISDKRGVVVRKIGEKVSEDAMEAVSKANEMIRESSPSSAPIIVKDFQPDNEAEIKVYDNKSDDSQRSDEFISPVAK